MFYAVIAKSHLDWITHRPEQLTADEDFLARMLSGNASSRDWARFVVVSREGSGPVEVVDQADRWIAAHRVPVSAVRLPDEAGELADRQAEREHGDFLNRDRWI